METTTYYPSDETMLERLAPERRDAFLTWIEDLETASDAWEKKHGWRPYERPIAESTGLECWYMFFDADYSPGEALAEDQSYD